MPTPSEPQTPSPSGTGSDRFASQGAGSRGSRRSDVLCLSILIAIPAGVFGAADIFGGHLLLASDNLVQNYPLRVLVGTDLRHGMLPLWDPFVWSGTPLMAGLNAGAFYPTTLLFAVSAHAAWVIGQIFVFATVSTGTYLLFRSGGSSPLASFLAAVSFSFAGAVAAQTAAHVDMGDGLAALPWALLAVRKISQDGRFRWALLLAGAGVLSILSGSPEAMLDTAAVCGIFALFKLFQRGATLWQYLSRLVAGAAVAVGLSAFFWVPALHYISSTQRLGAGPGFAAEFSFPASASILGVLPYLDGGYSLFSQPTFFGQSNIEEVAVYVGILPIIATLVLLTPTWRRRLPRGEMLCWYGILVVGIVLATGAQSPLEHVLYHIPFYGKQRDSGRNIVDVDLAVCALLALWVDARPRSRGERRPRLAWTEKLAALVPLGVVGFVGILFLVSPAILWIVVRGSPPFSPRSSGSGDAIILAGVITACGALLVFVRPRLSRTWFRRLVSAFVLVDIGLFSLGSAYLSAQQPPDPTHPGPVVSLVRANLSAGGRYAVFDPDLLSETQFVDSGEPDLGILDQLPSFSGYGSATDSRYASETGSQARGFLDISSLADGQFEQLGLQVLVTVPESFLVPIARLPEGDTPPKILSEQPGTDPALEGGNTPPPRPPLMTLGESEPRDVFPDETAAWWFGTKLAVSAVSVSVGEPTATGDLQVGIVSSDGAVRWLADGALSATDAGRVFDLGHASGEGLALRTSTGLQSVRVSVKTTAGRSYLVSGVLADAVTPGGWTEAGTADDFTVFRATYEPSPAWVQAAGTGDEPVVGGVKSIGSARVVSSTEAGTTVDSYATTPALLVWNSAWESGWRATLVAKGRDQPLTVQRVGLIQGVEVPAGSTVVRFTYQAPGLSKGIAVSCVTAATLVVALVIVVARRRRRSAPGAAPDSREDQ